MQDEMLFDATIAVSRSAWLISHGYYAANDPFMLYHRGLALARLYERVNFTASFAEVEVIFTIGRMLSIAVSVLHMSICILVADEPYEVHGERARSF